MSSRRKLALLAALCVVMTVVPMVAARAATTYTVQMGAGVPHGFSVRAFAPLDHGVPTVSVLTGDIINLKNGAIVLPEGETPLDWASENTEALDAPFGFIHSDPDPDLQEPFVTDAPYKVNLALFTPSDPTCGDTAENPCMFDGTSLLAGGDRFGIPQRAFYVRIDADAGSTLWAVALNKVNRHSSLKINVVASGASSQAAIDAARTGQLEKEREDAAALHENLNTRAKTTKSPSGATIHHAFAGFDTDTFALFDFYPAKLVLDKGDKVRWHFTHVSIELHGLAFPFQKGVQISGEGAVPVCDADGDSGSGYDTFDVDFDTFTCPEASGDLEFDLTRALTVESGDGKVPGGVDNSGLRGETVPSAPGLAGGTDPWTVTFTKNDAKGYDYVCTFHGKGMRGTVVVK